MLRQIIDIHDRYIGEIGHGFDAWHVRYQRSATDVDEDALCGEYIVVDSYAAWADEARMALEDGGILAHPFFDVVIGAADDFVLARLDRFHIDADLACDLHAVFGASPCQLCGIGARDHGFGRSAAIVDAGTVEFPPFHHSDLHAGVREASGKRGTGLAGADHDCVEGDGGHDWPPKGQWALVGSGMTALRASE